MLEFCKCRVDHIRIVNRSTVELPDNLSERAHKSSLKFKTCRIGPLRASLRRQLGNSGGQAAQAKFKVHGCDPRL